MFDVGQKVVCVDAKFEGWHLKLYKELPVLDVIYVVRDVRIGVTYSEGKRTGAVSLLLVGIVNPPADSKAGLERGFNSDRFRPLESHENEYSMPRYDSTHCEISLPLIADPAILIPA